MRTDELKELLIDMLCVTGREPSERMVRAYAIHIGRAFPDLAAADAVAAIDKAVSEHDAGFGVYWPAATTIEANIKAIVDARFSWDDLASGCPRGCYLGKISITRDNGSGPRHYTAACPACEAGRKRHELQELAFAEEEA